MLRSIAYLLGALSFAMVATAALANFDTMIASDNTFAAAPAHSIAHPDVKVVAVDETISALCRDEGTTYQRAGGFCDAVGNNTSLASGHKPSPCPVGYVHNHDWDCVPI